MKLLGVKGLLKATSIKHLCGGFTVDDLLLPISLVRHYVRLVMMGYPIYFRCPGTQPDER